MGTMQAALALWILGGAVTFGLVLVEAKAEEIPGVSKANTFGIFAMSVLFWPALLGGYAYRKIMGLKADN